MRWTRRLPSTTLSFRRADVAGFWILATTLLALVSGRMAVELQLPPLVWGAAAAALVLAPALWWRDWFYAGVATWNTFGVFMTSCLRRYTLAVSYYIVFAALGRAGSSLDVSRHPPQISKWLPLPNENTRRAGWAFGPTAEKHQTLPSWLAGNDRTWAWCVWPITTLLLLLKDEQRDVTPPSSTYTLY